MLFAYNISSWILLKVSTIDSSLYTHSSAKVSANINEHSLVMCIILLQF